MQMLDMKFKDEIRNFIITDIITCFDYSTDLEILEQEKNILTEKIFLKLLNYYLFYHKNLVACCSDVESQKLYDEYLQKYIYGLILEIFNHLQVSTFHNLSNYQLNLMIYQKLKPFLFNLFTCVLKKN